MYHQAIPSGSSGLHNLFFAIRPPVNIRHRIAGATASLPVGGKPKQHDRLHITVLQLIINAVPPAAMIEEALDVAASLRAAPFNVMFDHLVAGSKSMLLVPKEPLDALHVFRERLGFMLMRAGIDIHLSDPFKPHVTLLYGNELAFEAEIDPVIWKVEEFVLIDSLIGQTRHVELGRWQLQD